MRLVSQLLYYKTAVSDSSSTFFVPNFSCLQARMMDIRASGLLQKASKPTGQMVFKKEPQETRNTIQKPFENSQNGKRQGSLQDRATGKYNASIIIKNYGCLIRSNGCILANVENHNLPKSWDDAGEPPFYPSRVKQGARRKRGNFFIPSPAANLVGEAKKTANICIYSNFC